MNSTPCTAQSIMWPTALPPPPPTPITLIWVPWLKGSSSIISMDIFLSFSFKYLAVADIVWDHFFVSNHEGGSVHRHRQCGLARVSQSLVCMIKSSPQTSL